MNDETVLSKTTKDSCEEITEALRQFTRDRDWEQFHDAKNLALGLSIEAAELNEAFLWKKPEEASREKVAEELADVFLFAFMLADKYGFDPRTICLEKIARNASKYPPEKARGLAKKYTEL
jgi:NTP pyrophosphatase (non-canonical NTP hydrolase)